MAAQKGKDVLIKINTTGSTYVTLGGLRSSSITFSDEAVDITSKADNGHRLLLAGGGVNSVAISGSGVFTDSSAEQALRTAYYAQQNTSDGSSAQTAAFKNFQFVVPDLAVFTGPFMIESLEYAGEFNGEATYSVSFQSAGYVSFASN